MTLKQTLEYNNIQSGFVRDNLRVYKISLEQEDRWQLSYIYNFPHHVINILSMERRIFVYGAIAPMIFKLWHEQKSAFAYLKRLSELSIEEAAQRADLGMERSIDFAFYSVNTGVHSYSRSIAKRQLEKFKKDMIQYGNIGIADLAQREIDKVTSNPDYHLYQAAEALKKWYNEYERGNLGEVISQRVFFALGAAQRVVELVGEKNA